jgi:acyl-CoA thioesterase-1
MKLKITYTTILYLFFTFAVCNAQEEKKTILFFGDSITAGYGLEKDQAFPALIQKKIDSLGYSYNVVNAGLSGETSAGGLRRIDWIARQKIDIFVLELGGNDGLRGIEPESTKGNLIKIIKKVRSKYPDVKILFTGMQAPPNMGIDYTEKFKNIFYSVADSMDVHFYPFILENVAGYEELNLPDGIHPTAEGHQIIADNLWPKLKAIIER